jgi:flagellar hook-associated protein 2
VASISSTSSASSSSSIQRSGLSYDDVVTAKVQPLLDQIDTIDSKISENETKIAAYEDMQALLQNLANAVDVLRNPADQSRDVFNNRTAVLSSSGASDAEDLISAEVVSGTPSGKHTVVVEQIATAARISSDSQSSRSDALGLSGVFTIGEDGATAATITVADDDSLDEIVDQINQQADQTGITAAIVAVSTSSANPQYTLILTATDTNSEILLSTTSGTVLTDLGVTGADGSTAANVLQAAQPARITVDGIAGIERDSNDIDDVIDGVTLSLSKADPDSTITIEITNDTEAAQSAIEDFVEAYNSWREFVATNQETNSDGTAADGATLFGDSMLRSLSLSVDAALNAFVDGVSLGALGITLNSDNQLDLDSDTLQDMLSDNFAAVEALFEFQIASSSSNLTAISHDSSSFSGTITLDIETDESGNITGVSGVDGSGSAVSFTYSGGVIRGTTGSAYAGLVFKWSGSQSETVSITTADGIASQLYELADNAADTSTGSIQTIINNLQEQDDSLASKSDSLQARADSYAAFLLEQYGKLEASISQANQMADILQQLMDYDTSSN